MVSKEINNKLLELVPNIKDLFESVTSWQDGIDTGSTVVVEDVFMVFLRTSLDMNNLDEIQRCKAFIEWLADNNDDEYASYVLTISIFEYIHFSDHRTVFESVLGSKALNLYNSINWDVK